MADEVKVETQQQEVKPSYSWYRDKKMMGMVLLLVVVIFQIFAFLEVPFMSTIHGYTIGLLFGWYNPFFYVFVAYLSLLMIFGDKVKMPKWIKLNKLTYWIVAISIIFICVATGDYQTHNGWTTIGAQPWNSFNTWFDRFTSGPWWAPAQTNGGFIGVFLYSLFASMLSGIGALIVAIGSLVIVVSLMASGSFIGFYKQLHAMRTKKLESKEVKEENSVTTETFKDKAIDNNKESLNTKTQEVKVKEVAKPVVKNEDPTDLPFEDPFA